MSEQSLNDLSTRLRAVPKRAFLRIPTGTPLMSAQIDIGWLCHEAANALDRQHQAVQGDVVSIALAAYNKAIDDLPHVPDSEWRTKQYECMKAAITAMNRGMPQNRKDEECIGTTAAISANAITTSPANNSTTIQSDCKLNSSMPQGADLSREISVVDPNVVEYAKTLSWHEGIEMVENPAVTDWKKIHRHFIDLWHRLHSTGISDTPKEFADSQVLQIQSHFHAPKPVSVSLDKMATFHTNALMGMTFTDCMSEFDAAEVKYDL